MRDMLGTLLRGFAVASVCAVAPALVVYAVCGAGLWQALGAMLLTIGLHEGYWRVAEKSSKPGGA